jgi:hypothetical protein
MRIAALILLSFPVAVMARPRGDAFWAEGGSARAQGMGGASAALSEDLSALLSNPAALSTLDRSSLMAHAAPSPLGSTSFFTAYGRPLGAFRAAAGFFQRRSADIEVTNMSGTVLGKKSFTDQAVLAGLAAGKRWPVGVTVKRLQSRFSPYDVSGTGLDLGLQGANGRVLWGLAWQDVGGTSLSGDGYAGDSTGETIPSKMRIGLALAGAPLSAAFGENEGPWGLSINLAVDALMPVTGPRQPTAFFYGAELWSFRRVGLRGGWNQDRGWSTGASLNLGRLRVDYALLLTEDVPSLNRVTTHLFFGGQAAE